MDLESTTDSIKIAKRRDSDSLDALSRTAGSMRQSVIDLAEGDELYEARTTLRKPHRARFLENELGQHGVSLGGGPPSRERLEGLGERLSRLRGAAKTRHETCDDFRTRTLTRQQEQRVDKVKRNSEAVAMYTDLNLKAAKTLRELLQVDPLQEQKDDLGAEERMYLTARDMLANSAEMKDFHTKSLGEVYLPPKTADQLREEKAIMARSQNHKLKQRLWAAVDKARAELSTKVNETEALEEEVARMGRELEGRGGKLGFEERAAARKKWLALSSLAAQKRSEVDKASHDLHQLAEKEASVGNPESSSVLDSFAPQSDKTISMWVIGNPMQRGILSSVYYGNFSTSDWPPESGWIAFKNEHKPRPGDEFYEEVKITRNFLERAANNPRIMKSYTITGSKLESANGRYSQQGESDGVLQYQNTEGMCLFRTQRLEMPDLGITRDACNPEAPGSSHLQFGGDVWHREFGEVLSTADPLDFVKFSKAGLRLVTLQRRDGNERRQDHINELERRKEEHFSGTLRRAAKTLKRLETSKSAKDFQSNVQETAGKLDPLRPRTLSQHQAEALESNFHEPNITYQDMVDVEDPLRVGSNNMDITNEEVPPLCKDWALAKCPRKKKDCFKRHYFISKAEKALNKAKKEQQDSSLELVVLREIAVREKLLEEVKEEAKNATKHYMDRSDANPDESEVQQLLLLLDRLRLASVRVVEAIEHWRQHITKVRAAADKKKSRRDAGAVPTRWAVSVIGEGPPLYEWSEEFKSKVARMNRPRHEEKREHRVLYLGVYSSKQEAELVFDKHRKREAIKKRIPESHIPNKRFVKRPCGKHYAVESSVGPVGLNRPCEQCTAQQLSGKDDYTPAYIWNGENYILKLCSDTQYLDQVKPLKLVLGNNFTFKENPFMLNKGVQGKDATTVVTAFSSIFGANTVPLQSHTYSSYDSFGLPSPEKDSRSNQLATLPETDSGLLSSQDSLAEGSSKSVSFAPSLHTTFPTTSGNLGPITESPFSRPHSPLRDDISARSALNRPHSPMRDDISMRSSHGLASPLRDDLSIRSSQRGSVVPPLDPFAFPGSKAQRFGSPTEAIKVHGANVMEWQSHMTTGSNFVVGDGGVQDPRVFASLTGSSILGPPVPLTVEVLDFDRVQMSETIINQELKLHNILKQEEAGLGSGSDSSDDESMMYLDTSRTDGTDGTALYTDRSKQKPDDWEVGKVTQVAVYWDRGARLEVAQTRKKPKFREPGKFAKRGTAEWIGTGIFGPHARHQEFEAKLRVDARNRIKERKKLTKLLKKLTDGKDVWELDVRKLRKAVKRAKELKGSRLTVDAAAAAAVLDNYMKTLRGCMKVQRIFRGMLGRNRAARLKAQMEAAERYRCLYERETAKKARATVLDIVQGGLDRATRKIIWPVYSFVLPYLHERFFVSVLSMEHHDYTYYKTCKVMEQCFWCTLSKHKMVYNYQKPNTKIGWRGVCSCRRKRPQPRVKLRVYDTLNCRSYFLVVCEDEMRHRLKRAYFQEPELFYSNPPPVMLLDAYDLRRLPYDWDINIWKRSQWDPLREQRHTWDELNSKTIYADYVERERKKAEQDQRAADAAWERAREARERTQMEYEESCGRLLLAVEYWQLCCHNTVLALEFAKQSRVLFDDGDREDWRQAYDPFEDGSNWQQLRLKRASWRAVEAACKVKESKRNGMFYGWMNYWEARRDAKEAKEWVQEMCQSEAESRATEDLFRSYALFSNRLFRESMHALVHCVDFQTRATVPISRRAVLRERTKADDLHELIAMRVKPQRNLRLWQCLARKAVFLRYPDVPYMPTNHYYHRSRATIYVNPQTNYFYMWTDWLGETTFMLRPIEVEYVLKKAKVFPPQISNREEGFIIRRQARFWTMRDVCEGLFNLLHFDMFNDKLTIGQLQFFRRRENLEALLRKSHWARDIMAKRSSNRGAQVYEGLCQIAVRPLKIFIYENWGDLLVEAYDPRMGGVYATEFTVLDIVKSLQQNPLLLVLYLIGVQLGAYSKNLFFHLLMRLDLQLPGENGLSWRLQFQNEVPRLVLLSSATDRFRGPVYKMHHRVHGFAVTSRIYVSSTNEFLFKVSPSEDSAVTNVFKGPVIKMQTPPSTIRKLLGPANQDLLHPHKQPELYRFFLHRLAFIQPQQDLSTKMNQMAKSEEANSLTSCVNDFERWRNKMKPPILLPDLKTLISSDQQEQEVQQFRAHFLIDVDEESDSRLVYSGIWNTEKPQEYFFTEFFLEDSGLLRVKLYEELEEEQERRCEVQERLKMAAEERSSRRAWAFWDAYQARQADRMEQRRKFEAQKKQTFTNGPRLRRLLNRMKTLEKKFEDIEQTRQKAKKDRAQRTAELLKEHLELKTEGSGRKAPVLGLKKEAAHWACSITQHDRNLRGSLRNTVWRPKTSKVKASKKWNLGKARFDGIPEQSSDKLVLRAPVKVGDELCLLCVFFLEETGKLLFSAYFPRQCYVADMCTWAYSQQFKDEIGESVEDSSELALRYTDEVLFQGLKNAALSKMKQEIHEFYVPPKKVATKAPKALFKSLVRTTTLEQKQKREPWRKESPVYQWPVLVMGMDPLAPSEVIFVECGKWTSELRAHVGIKSGDMFCKNLNDHGSVYFKPPTTNSENLNVKATCIFGLEAEGSVVFVAGTTEKSLEPIVERDLDLIVEIEMEIEDTEERILKRRNERRKWKKSILKASAAKASELEPSLKFSILSKSGCLKAVKAVAQVRSIESLATRHCEENRPGYDFSQRPKPPTEMSPEPSACVLWKTLVRLHILKCQLAPSSCPLDLCRTVRIDAREILDNTITEEDTFDDICAKFEGAVEQLLVRDLCPCTLHFSVKDETAEELREMATTTTIRAKTTKKTSRAVPGKPKGEPPNAAKRKTIAGWRKLMNTMVKTSVKIRVPWEGIILDYDSDSDGEEATISHGHVSLSGRMVHSREASRRTASTCTLNLHNLAPLFPFNGTDIALPELVLKSETKSDAWPLRNEPQQCDEGAISWIMGTLRFTSLPSLDSTRHILSNDGKDHIGKIYATATYGTRGMCISGRHCLLTISLTAGRLFLESYSPHTCASFTFLVGEKEISKLKRLYGSKYELGNTHQQLAKFLLKFAQKVFKLVKENEGMRLSIEDPAEDEKQQRSTDLEMARLVQCEMMRKEDNLSKDVSIKAQKLFQDIEAVRRKLVEKRDQRKRQCIFESIKEWAPMAVADNESQKLRGYLSALPSIIEEIDKIFDLYDEDADDLLNSQELQLLLEDLTVVLAPEQVLSVIQRDDNSKLGLSRQDMHIWWTTFSDAEAVILAVAQQIKKARAKRQVDKFKAHAEAVGKSKVAIENMASYSKAEPEHPEHTGRSIESRKSSRKSGREKSGFGRISTPFKKKKGINRGMSFRKKANQDSL